MQCKHSFHRIALQTLPECCSFFSAGTLLFIFLLVSLCSPVAGFSETPSIVPRNGIVLKTTEQLPWMQEWQKARELVREGELNRAKAEYQKLFLSKPHIEEALREYVLVLMQLNDWQEAAGVIPRLLELDSASPEYQLYAGRVALQQKRYEQAAKYFGQLYTLYPDGKYAIESLQGLVLSLQKMHKKELVYPLMEQLYLQVPHDADFIRTLARYSLDLGYSDKACDYFQTLFSEFQGKDRDFLQAADLFEKSGNMPMAVYCWQGYLNDHSYYLPFHQKLSAYYLSNGLERSALSHLLVQVALNDSRPELLLTIGQIYLYQEGRPDKALYYYEEYKKQRPGDETVLADIKRIQTVLAGDFLVIVENEGAWPLWRDLKKITPDRLAIYSRMATKLEESGKMKELLEVLQIIHIHDPENQEVIFRLAQLYFVEDQFQKSKEMLDTLGDEEKQGKDYFFLRARIEEKQGDLFHTLQYYKQYISVYPGDSQVVLKCLGVAGRAGLMQDLDDFYSFLQAHFTDPGILESGDRLYGEALVFNGLPSTGGRFYQNILDGGGLDSATRSHYEQERIHALQKEKKFFSAEAALRNRLNQVDQRQPVLLQLIDNNMQAGDRDTAWEWYEILVQLNGKSETLCDSVDVQLFTEKILLLENFSEFDDAIDLLEDFLDDFEESCGERGQGVLELNGILARIYHENGDYSDAAELFSRYPALSSLTPELHILEQYLFDVNQGDNDLGHLLAYIQEQAGEMPSKLLAAAEFLQGFGNYRSALQLVEKHLQLVPDSLRGQVVRGELLVQLEDVFAALPLFVKLAVQYPEEHSFERTVLELQFQLAQFEPLINTLAPNWKNSTSLEEPFLRTDVEPDVLALEPWKQLLLARTFWAVRRWNDSLQIYEALLSPPVDKLFMERISTQRKELVLPPPQKTFWNTITLTTPAEPDRLRTVMSPEFTANYFDNSVVSIATSLYEAFRLQKIVSTELSVRRAMEEGTYYQAMKEYQNLLQEGLSPESMFDLAGVYSRLGFLGKEAALYELMAVESPGYPNLDEAIQRNALKRKPQIVFSTLAAKKTGRDGYYDNRQVGGSVESRFMPTLRHGMSLDYSRLRNRSVATDCEIFRNRFFTDIEWNPMYDFDLLFGAGVDSVDDSSGSTFLYTLQLNGRVGDMVQAHIGLNQDVVDDSVTALQEQIHKSVYEAGLTLDFLPRLFGGAGYFFTEFSDGNHQNRYDIWTSYTLHSEPLLLQFRYGYEYFHNGNENRGGRAGALANDPLYWSPKEYWQHLFTVSFEHQLGYDILGRGAPSYYSLEYSFGYELEGYGNHEFNANIYLEISRHFLFNGNFDYINGAEFEKQDFLLSLIYRW